MSVRAKVVLNRYETYMFSRSNYNEETQKYESETFEARTLVFNPVVGNSEENKKFFAATPSGEFKLSVVNPDAWKQFELNKEYYLDFTPAEGDKSNG